jgi:LPS sulfotransferase NodH
VVTVAAFRAFNRKIGEVAVFLGALLSATGASGDGGVHFKLARLASWCSGFGERERAASKGMLRQWMLKSVRFVMFCHMT